MDHPVSQNPIIRDTYLWDAPGRRRDSHELELPEQFVVCRHLPLALVHLDLHLCLPVGRRREHLRLFGGDRRVAADEFGEDAAEGLDAERERGHVQEEHVRHVAGQHAALNEMG